MKNILILYTGGTIGCAGFPLAPMSSDQFQACLSAVPDMPTQLSWTLKALPTPLDSAAMQPADWLAIARILLDSWTQFDGFVVLHGTDTLAWTAAALSFLLPGIDKPLVLTGAQRPLAQTGSDAEGNLRDALLVAAQWELAEVMVSFAGQVLRGNRCVKVDSEADAAFDSPACPALGSVRGGVFQGASLTCTSGAVALSANLAQCTQRLDRVSAGIAEASSAVIYMHPGFSANALQAVLSASSLPQLWVLVCFGTGNVPDSPMLRATLAAVTERGGAVVAVTQALRGSVQLGVYASSAPLLSTGVIPGADMSIAAAHAKLLILHAEGLRGEALRAAMLSPLAGELGAG